ncbi:hypothetical protein CYMTET_6675 [Cymbomonas tetramitiformis]|uniref:Uncharacterized protein n=1 Tax=Cymbomonas tetramitiformis TaxID=36881 RepID=A0AAE0GWY7_9CHLO|nr:hypothetical protein CYMTET_6675 [Cymbomonas tetramitiformis]
MCQVMCQSLQETNKEFDMCKKEHDYIVLELQRMRDECGSLANSKNSVCAELACTSETVAQLQAEAIASKESLSLFEDRAAAEEQRVRLEHRVVSEQLNRTKAMEEAATGELLKATAIIEALKQERVALRNEQQKELHEASERAHQGLATKLAEVKSSRDDALYKSATHAVEADSLRAQLKEAADAQRSLQHRLDESVRERATATQKDATYVQVGDGVTHRTMHDSKPNCNA